MLGGVFYAVRAEAIGGWCEPTVSLGVSWINEWVVRQSPASKDANTEAEVATMLEAVTRQQPMKI
jgi:hypothetical protein